MVFSRSNISRECIVCLAASLSFAAGLSVARAQAGPESVSTLQQLSDDSQRLYEKVHLGVVRVQLPTPQWLEQVNEQEKLLQKWGAQLNPDVVNQLRQEQLNAQNEHYRQMGAVAATQPSDVPTTQAVTIGQPQPPSGQLQFRRLQSANVGNRVLVATGLLIDNQGHVVVPLFVDPQAIGTAPLRVAMGDGSITLAKYIGSDKLTNLSVIQLDNRDGLPVSLSAGKPGDGSLTMVISADGSAKLIVWTSQHPEPGLVVEPDGSMAGFGYQGGLLTAAKFKPIVDQIIATGKVHRAVLGVIVRDVKKEDSLRQSVAALGIKPAIRVEYVEPGSAAERGGLQIGDLILTIAGEPVGENVFAAVIAVRSGKTDLRIIRDAQEMTINVDLQRK